MLVELDDARLQSADPPDAPPIEVMHHVRNGARGRPKIEIDANFLREAGQLRGNAELARFLGCSARTVRRHMLREGLQTPGEPVYSITSLADGTQITEHRPRQARRQPLSDEELDRHMQQVLQDYPNFGRSMLAGHFQALGLNVTRIRLIESYLRVHGSPAVFGDRTIHRREYRVAGANSLWHHDGQHGSSEQFCMNENFR